ncbi:hypothetical protein OG948_05420 [Embleya sp. NBC_00888]|uniref:hypothetical protein n=1 Tax=Embleya sp. NBC_00888 TaxID=2975960 RepID=UPI003866CEE1|nr:hypothetical protein OG948_05420 [Embleya sp. NBC_00888]
MTLTTTLPGQGPPPTDPADPGPDRTRRLAARWNVAMVLLPAAFLAVWGGQRSWLCDDGLIFTRTVRQILAGNGPVFNPGERAEAATSTLWQWLLVAGTELTGQDPAPLAVRLGLLCSVIGWFLAADAGRRLHLPRSDAAFLLPCGALVLLALPPVWDFATSGLETGLTTLWTAGCWWLLVHLARDPRSHTAHALALLAGLGPMVRPDLAIAGLGFLIALALVHRPRPARALALLGTAGALPLAYEIFRMGYYGVLLPLPAITKEASAADWSRGWAYVHDLADPYHLWLPVLILAASVTAAAALAVAVGAAATASRPRPPTPARSAPDTRTRLRVLYAVPILSGLTMLLYVVRVGGDFMHGRMLLPGLFVLLLPILMVPANRIAVPAVSALAVWSLLTAIAFRVPYTGIGPGGVADERGFYTSVLGVANPVTADVFIDRFPGFPTMIRGPRPGYRHTLVDRSPTHSFVVPLRPDLNASIVAMWPSLGMNGAATPITGIALDDLGLAYPLAAHIHLTTRGRPGHEKRIDPAWVLAEYADPAAPAPPGIDPIRIAAARYTLTCGTADRGRLKELRDSVRAPMSWRRFAANLAGAPARTAFRFPNDPIVAARQICGVDVLAPGVLPTEPTPAPVPLP